MSISPQCPCRGRLSCLLLRQVFISGESIHCFLVGWCTNKTYVIATSDLWLFIHASNLLPSTPHPHSPTKPWRCDQDSNLRGYNPSDFPSVLYTCSGPWPYNLFFPVLFLFDWVGLSLAVLVSLRNSWFGPAHFDLMSQERSGTTSASARDALWCHALRKRKRTGKKRL